MDAVSLARADRRHLRWQDAEPGNVHGVARALTAIGPLAPGRRYWKLLLGFWLRRHVGLYRKQRARGLRRLSFIHFARWVLIRDLPDADGTSRRPLRPVYMYFESNFNGPFEEYIDAFADVLTGPDEATSSAPSTTSPGPQPAGPFKAFIRRHDYAAEHFYSAYPETTATDAGRALKVAEEFERLRRDAATGCTPEEFARRWRGFLTEVEGCAVSRDPNVMIGGKAYALTVILAIRPGNERLLRRRIVAWRRRRASPFARLPVHALRPPRRARPAGLRGPGAAPTRHLAAVPAVLGDVRRRRQRRERDEYLELHVPAPAGGGRRASSACAPGRRARWPPTRRSSGTGSSATRSRRGPSSRTGRRRPCATSGARARCAGASADFAFRNDYERPAVLKESFERAFPR